MKVAFDVGPLRPNPAGVGLYVRSLVSALAALLPGNLVAIGRRADAFGLPDIPMRSRAAVPYPAWVTMFGGLDARRALADVTHYTDGLAPIALKPPKSVVTVHDLSIVREWRSHSLRRLGRVPLVLLAPHLVTRVIADSRATADELMALARVKASRIDVVPLAPRAMERPDPSEVRAVLDRFALAEDRFVLIPGTLEPRKNHQRVIRAFEDASASGQLPGDLRLVLAGSFGWRSEPIRRAIDRSPMRAQISILGYVPDPDLLALMTGAAVVAYVSTYEGFGLPVLEAMSCGAAVLTSSVSSMPEVAGDAAVLADPLDPEAIARGLARSWHDRTDLRSASIARAGRFTWSQTAEQTVDVYRRAIAV